MREEGLSRSELIAIIGGLMLAIGVFLTWYKIDKGNSIGSHDGPARLSACQVHTVSRWLLLLAAIAPLILAWIIYRGHALSWPRGEMTAVSAIAAAGLIVYMTIIDKPGETTGLTHLRWGVFVALAGALLMLGGSATRASSVERPRKPPGTI